MPLYKPERTVPISNEVDLFKDMRTLNCSICGTVADVRLNDFAGLYEPQVIARPHGEAHKPLRVQVRQLREDVR